MADIVNQKKTKDRVPQRDRVRVSRSNHVSILSLKTTEQLSRTGSESSTFKLTITVINVVCNGSRRLENIRYALNWKILIEWGNMVNSQPEDIRLW